MPNHEYYDAYVRRARLRHSDKFDDSQLVAKFRPFLHNAQRIRVQDGDYIRTGTVGITTGWRPAFLLMHRSSDHGSGDLLSERSMITHVQHGRTYVPVANLHRDPNTSEIEQRLEYLRGEIRATR